MPRITKTQLERHAECRAAAVELRRQADTLSKEADSIESIALADLTSTGRSAVTRSGYRLETVETRGSVSWKSELVARCGADAADQIAAAAPVKHRLRITAPKLPAA